MIYCSNCGTRIESETEFCPNCGVKIELESYVSSNRKNRTTTISQPTPAPSHPQTPTNTHPRTNARHPHKRRRLVVAMIILGIFVLTGTVGTSVFLEKTVVNEQRTYTFNIDPGLVTMDFDFDISSADVEYSYNSTPMENAIVIHATFDYSIRSFSQMPIDKLYTITAENGADSASFIIDRRSIFSYSFWDRSEISVMLRTDLDYDLSIKTGSGNIDALFPSNTDFTSVHAETGSGDLSVAFAGNHSLSDSLSLNAGSGNIDLTAESMILGSDFTAETGSGEMDISFTAVRIHGDVRLDTGSGNMVFDTQRSEFYSPIEAETGSGSQTMIFDAAQFSGDIEFSIGSGNFVLDMTEITLVNTIDINMDGSSGNVDISLTQSEALGSLLTGEFETGSGEITVELDIASDVVPAYFEWDQGSGDFYSEIADENHTLIEESLQLGTYSETTGLVFALSTGSGDISISA